MKRLILTLSILISSIGLYSQQLPFNCPDTVCVGQNVTYGVNNTVGSTYNWSLTPVGPLIPTTNTQNITWNYPAGNYTLQVVETNSFNCVGLPKVCNVTVVDVTASITQIGPFCSGTAPVQLTGIPAGGTFSGPNVTNGFFNPSTPGVYPITYTYTNPQGCTATATISVTVNPTPVTSPIQHN